MNVVSTEPRSFRRFFSDLGPGLITGAADDDPSGISTYSVAGAGFGYAPLWTALFSFPLMAAVQLMCARLGMVTGKGLAGVVHQASASNWLMISDTSSAEAGRSIGSSEPYYWCRALRAYQSPTSPTADSLTGPRRCHNCLRIRSTSPGS
jgi:hypothetical protein